MLESKKKVKEFWNNASCGEDLYLIGQEEKIRFQNQAHERYRLEPFILPFADFEKARGKRVLEIGVGLGSDHQKFAEAGALLTGVDLTERAIAHANRRFELFGLKSELHLADAENLPFDSDTFDFVYSWGVIHHSPNTEKCVDEIWRVLKPNSECRVMIYHKHSMVGYMLWVRYALLKGKPWINLTEIYARYLESPGTKAYTIREAREMFKNFHDVHIETILGHGDLLTSQAGQRHRGWHLNVAKALYPRWIVRNLFPSAGLAMLIKAQK